MPYTRLAAALGLTDDPRHVARPAGEEGVIVSHNPATGEPIAGVRADTPESYERTIAQAQAAFHAWRAVPAPRRGLVVRAIGDELRRHKEALGELISLEVGKIRSEGLGEVQEVIDIADFAVGLSRQVGGPTLPSERPDHRMYEQWLPLGPVGVITAFNFPAAVWGWNAMLAAVCGDSVAWKPSVLAPLTALATNRICARAAEDAGFASPFHLVIGSDAAIGERLISDPRLPLISATGSCRMGRRVGQVVAGRLGRSLLELGGNNAVIVEADADLDLAMRSIVFAAVGTAGQRCTTTRRLILHESIADAMLERLVAAYRSIRIGSPLEPGVLMGPLISASAVAAFEEAVATAKAQGGRVLTGGSRASVSGLAGHFVQPTIIRAPPDNRLGVADDETFAPILYVFTFAALDEAIAMNNGVTQGLSSAMFTRSLVSAERFLSVDGGGSDCGIANINIGTSGAEIGGAFGGEKETGGGREAGSDSWKAYMRRQTVTINFGRELALAQGIRFD
jgi:aldehyde dehydrogenase (NAD+)